MKLNLLLFIIIFTPFFNFAQKEVSKSISIDFTGGMVNSKYRYFKYYKGYENINVGISKPFSKKYGITIQQSYSRLFNEKTNNRSIVNNSSINTYICFLPDKKINILTSIGSGFMHIQNKCLYKKYPYKDNLFGLPIKSNLTLLYNIKTNISLNLNIEGFYSFLFYNQNHLPENTYYYKAFFISTNVGIRYSFNKTD